MESEKISLFLTFFSGEEAGRWAHDMMIEIYEKDDDYSDSDSDEDSYSGSEGSAPVPAPPRFTWTLRKLKRRFLRDFKLTSLESQAQTKIETMRMEGVLSDIDKYNSQFRFHAKNTGYNDKALMKYYKKGLPKGSVDRISYLERQPKTLENLQRCAVKLHLLWVE